MVWMRVFSVWSMHSMTHLPDSPLPPPHHRSVARVLVSQPAVFKHRVTIPSPHSHTSIKHYPDLREQEQHDFGRKAIYLELFGSSHLTHFVLSRLPCFLRWALSFKAIQSRVFWQQMRNHCILVWRKESILYLISTFIRNWDRLLWLHSICYSRTYIRTGRSGWQERKVFAEYLSL